MKPAERKTMIANAVAAEGLTSVEALAARFGVSAETIRRDLATLAATGLVQKVHGGARPGHIYVESRFSDRLAQNAAAKRAIAARLAALVQPGQMLLMDTGSTTISCAEALTHHAELTIVTNSLQIAAMMGRAEGHPMLHLLGGQFLAESGQTVGPVAIEQIARYQADYAVISAVGVDAHAGVTNTSFEEAQIARAMMANANRTILVADASKIGRVAAHRVCRLGDVGMLLCEDLSDPVLGATLVAAGVAIG